MTDLHDAIAQGLAKALHLKCEKINNRPLSKRNNHEDWYYFRWKKWKRKPRPHTQHHARLIIFYDGKIYMGPNTPTDPISDLNDPNLINNLKTALTTWGPNGRST